MVTIKLIQQQALDAYPKTKQQFNFAGNPQRQATIFFITEVAKENVLDFSQETVKYALTVNYKMNQYKTLNVKLSNSEFNKLKLGIKLVVK